MNRPVVKVCGVTQEEEIDQLARLGVDFFGLLVDVPSPWKVSLARARQLAANGIGRIRATLVTRQRDPGKLRSLIAETGVRAIQLGVQTSPADIVRLRDAFPPRALTILQEIPHARGRFWKEDQVGEFLAAGADYILLDKLVKTPASEAPSTIPLEDLRGFGQRHAGRPVLIAGGLNADNAPLLIEASRAVGIDVCSSVRHQGRICPQRVESLLQCLPADSQRRAGTPPSLRAFLHAAASGKQVLAYLTLGDPPDRFIEAADEVLAAGALTLELGFPCEQPREGPALLASHHRALAAGVDTRKALELFGRIAKAHPRAPLVAVVQWPALGGPDQRIRFLDELAAAGAAAVLPVGIPLVQLPSLAARARERELQLVLSAHVDAPANLRQMIYRYASGCLYVARGKETGGVSPQADVAGFCQLLSQETDLPIVVGFGVATADDVREICQTPAKAAAVGSALVEHIAQHGSAGEFIRRLLA
jgi:tryptophan synthase alpha chain